jgi:transitional endoplasmic reticulum ATPase
MYELKAKLERDVILSLRYPEEARRYGIPLPNGILLYGPPGCGKTFIGRKIAEKLDFNFLEIKPGDLASTYVHGTQEKIKQVFEEAAKNAPSVLFFDELDAFTPKRQAAGHHYSAEVDEFLVRLNNCSNDGVLVIGATNHADRIDDAVLRPGRMDMHYFVGLPDYSARTELFKHHLSSRPCARLDFNHLA